MFILAKLLSKNSDPRKNHLRFIYLSASLGGIMCGGGFSYYFAEKLTKLKLSLWDKNWDNKQFLNEEEEINDDNKKRGVRHIYFVRHGQYLVDEDLDINQKLTKNGQLQAQITGEKLKKINFDQIWVSNLTRAQQTQDIMSKNWDRKSFQIDEKLAEGYPCFASPDFNKVTKQNEEKLWLEDDQGKRISEAFKQHFGRSERQDNSVELYVFHANVIRFFICKLLQFPEEGWLRFSLNHCSITEFQIFPDGSVKILRIGDSGHLPENLQTV